MKVEKKIPAFEDARGAIIDIFVGKPKEHITIITTEKGGVRGNHYHKHSQQSDYLVDGSFDVYYQRVGEEKVEHVVWNAGELIEWDLSEAHEFIAREYSTFITFINGPRGGDDFEKDTYRLETPLHEQFETRD
ncbi:hypothetical protein C4585_01935 [Candidatus Parcubacteria bacterium]|nr:MAG: hypothetical protein C4585_01935 [Candidatus Parcubacteria bacterium]